MRKILNKNSQILYSENPNELAQMKQSSKLLQKQSFHLSLLSNYESFGFVEWSLGCPYSLFSIKCHSREGLIFKLDRVEFFRRVKQPLLPISKIVKHKLDFLAKRIISLNETAGLSIPEHYFQIINEASFDSIATKNNPVESESDESSTNEEIVS